MNKADLVEALVKKTKSTKKAAEDFINSFIDAVKGELKKGGSVQLIGFGSFKVAKRAARVGRNPKTGKELKIPAKKVAKFVAGQALKDAVK
jgi:DNA-binding protein HU-beta